MLGTPVRRQKKLSVIKQGQAFLLVSLLVVAGFLNGCDSPAPAPAQSVLSVRLDDGVAWLGGQQQGTQLDHQQSIGMFWSQMIWAEEDKSATLFVEEDDQLWLDPGSGFQLVSSIQLNQRPALRLLEGGLRYRAASDRYALSVHIEVPFELQMLVTDLVVEPVVAATELEMVIDEDDVTTLTVLSGEVTALGNGVSETLFADWRAIVRPGEPMEVIPPVVPDTPTPTPTPTPTATSTPIATSTLDVTATVTLTPTATLTPTPTVILTFTPWPTSPPTPLATSTPVPTAPPPPPPTRPPATKPPPTQPPPTQPPPTQPPPTEPPPTEPPTVEPSSTPRPTPGG